MTTLLFFLVLLLHLIFLLFLDHTCCSLFANAIRGGIGGVTTSSLSIIQYSNRVLLLHLLVDDCLGDLLLARALLATVLGVILLLAFSVLRDLAEQLHLELAAQLNDHVARPAHLHGLLVDEGLPVPIKLARRAVLEHLEQL